MNIHILSNYINSYAISLPAETYIRNNTQGWWCVEHGTVKGTEILFNGETIGGTEDFRSFILGCADLGKIYVADGYAASSTYHEVIDILKENGFDYESE